MSQPSVNNILIIEDDQRDFQIITDYLREATFKYKVFHSPSLVGGIEVIEEEPITVVLLDLFLDDTSGFKTLTNYLKNAGNIPVIVLTGNTKESFGLRFVKAGAQDFLIKGKFDQNRLINSINYAIQRFKSQAKLQEQNHQLAIVEKRYREALKIGNYTNWEMNIVSNEMKWSDEMFEIFGFSPQSFQPKLMDYLRYVYIEDKEEVEAFFDKAVKTGELETIKHRILVNGSQIKFLSISVLVQYDEITNKIILFGNLKEITDSGVNSDSDNQSPEGIKIEVSSALPRNFDLTAYHVTISEQLGQLFGSDLDSKQRETLQNMAYTIANYTKLSSSFQNLLPLLEQSNTDDDQEFRPNELIESFQKIFQFQKALDRAPVNFILSENLSTVITGRKKEIQNIIFNVILQLLANNPAKQPVDIKVQEIDQNGPKLQFVIEFNGDFTNLESIINLAQGSDIFQIKNLKSSLKLYHLDFLTLAFLMKSSKSTFHIQQGVPNRLVFNFIVRKTDSKIKNGIIAKPTSILMVDNHKMNQVIMKGTLTTWSEFISIDMAESAHELDNKLSSTPYDLIILNINHPALDSAEITKKISSEWHIPVIGLSSLPSAQEKKHFEEAGLKAYLEKPYQNELLFSEITRVLGNL